MKTLDGQPFENPGCYRSYGRPGEIAPGSPLLRLQPFLPPSGRYFVRHFRYHPSSASTPGMWFDEWQVARVSRPEGPHGAAPCPGQDYHPGFVALIGMNTAEAELYDFSEAEWRTLPDPPELEVRS